MRRKFVVFTAAAAVFAALAVAGLSEPAPVVLPESAARSASGPLLGLTPAFQTLTQDQEMLARIDPSRLRALGRPRTVVVNLTAWSYSPGRDAVALGIDPSGDGTGVARLRVLDVASLKTRKRFSVGAGSVAAIAWVGPDRALVVVSRCCSDASLDLVVADPFAGKVLSRARFAGDLVRAVPAGDGLAVLVAPTNAIGVARLLVLDATGRVQAVPLTRIEAGWLRTGPDDAGEMPVVAQNVPGLAADGTGTRAYVVSGSGLTAEVDLRSLAVGYHTPVQPASLLGRASEFLQPVAEAKGVDGPSRDARWVGGVLVVTGTNEQGYSDAHGNRQFRSSPSGLQLIDTSTWAARMLDPGATRAVIAGDSLLATGESWGTESAVQSGMGLSAYGFDGRLRFHDFGSQAAYVILAIGGRAFVSPAIRSVTRIVDVASGRIVGRRRAPVPRVLFVPSGPVPSGP